MARTQVYNCRAVSLRCLYYIETPLNVMFQIYAIEYLSASLNNSKTVISFYFSDVYSVPFKAQMSFHSTQKVTDSWNCMLGRKHVSQRDRSVL